MPPQPLYADVYHLICGEDDTNWPKLTCAEADQTVELRTSLGAVSILTGATPTERLRITQDGSVQVQGSLSVSNELIVGGKQVIDSNGNWTGEPTGTRSWVDGDQRVTTSLRVGIGTATPGNFRLKVEGGDVHMDGALTVAGTLTATNIQGKLADRAVSRAQLNLTLVADGEVAVEGYADGNPGRVEVLIELATVVPGQVDEHRFYLTSCRIVGPANVWAINGVSLSHPQITWRHAISSAANVVPTPPFDRHTPSPVIAWLHHHQLWIENWDGWAVTVAYEIYRLD